MRIISSLRQLLFETAIFPPFRIKKSYVLARATFAEGAVFLRGREREREREKFQY